MDSHVRERIVGAAVLVALGVWLIPWVLDGPESEPATVEAPPLQLPSPDSPSPIRTETVELATRQAASSHARAAEASQAAVSEPPPVVRSTSADATGPAGEPPAATALPAAQPGAQGAAGGGRADWSVQLGAFGERANASQLAGRVADFGYEAEVTEFRSNGRTMYRVRVEGFATRERAEAASSSLAAHGIIPADVVPAD